MKTKLFALGLCAVVAFASCSKDDDAPALLTPISESFDNGTANAAIAITDWNVVNVKGNLSWNIKKVGPNKYAEVTTFRGKTETPLAVGDYESWLVSPVLDLTKGKIKSFSFESAYNFWKEGNVFEVYVLTNADPTKCTPVKLDAKIPTSADGFEVWYNSGNIDLSKYTGKIYIAFKYVGAVATDPTKSATTTFRLDNFKINVEPKEAETSATALTVDKAIVAAAQDSTIKWVNGYVIGTAVGKTGTSGGYTIKTTGFGTSDNTNLVLAATANETDPAKCIAVQLPKGNIRAKLNLLDNSTLLGKQVAIRGIAFKYFKTPGLIGSSDYLVK